MGFPNVKDVRTPGWFSRRGFLRTAAVIGAATRSAPLRAAAARVVAYVGGYTDRSGNGLYIYDLNPADGTLTRRTAMTEYPNPSSLAIAPSRRFLYAANEISNFDANRSGSVTSFAIQPDGGLRFLNVVSSRGAGPAHISVDPSGKWVFAANYGGGSASVLPIMADGSLGYATDVQSIPTSPLGPRRAVDGPPFSFADSGHDAPHAHMAQTDPGGNFLLVSDLGTDRIYVYRLDKTFGTLTPANQPWVQANPGAGPRHFSFHPNGRWLYSLNEEANTLDFISYRPNTGTATLQQTISTLPPGYQGTDYTSEVHVSEDGRFVYAANRLHNSIALLGIDQANGRVTWLKDFWTRGDYPRFFAIEPNGNFLYVLHSRSDNITTFEVNRSTGDLEFTGKFTGVFSPSHMAFLTL